MKIFPYREIVSTLWRQLTWTLYMEIVSTLRRQLKGLHIRQWVGFVW